MIEFMAGKLGSVGRLRVLDINGLLKQIFDHGKKYFGIIKKGIIVIKEVKKDGTLER